KPLAPKLDCAQEAFQRGAAKHGGKPPVIILDNISTLGKKFSDTLNDLQDDTKTHADRMDYVVVFVSRIVTNAKSWRFLRWAGSLERPIIQISDEHSCGEFVGEMEGSKSILGNIIRVLLLAIEGFDTEYEPTEGERRTQRQRSTDQRSTDQQPTDQQH
ncbi:hypothetical protein BC937DRAFT_88612, partial [Endogone sp. FLAS-F59071]